MPFTENLAPFFADFGGPATLAGVAVVGMLDLQSEVVVGDVLTLAPTWLLRPTTAVVPAEGQALVANGITYTVRQVLREPPDGALQRLVLARA